MRALTVGQVADVLDELYPPETAESWDVVGLAAGSPNSLVRRVHFTVDVTSEVVAEAAAAGAHLIVAHHPPLLHAVTSVSEAHPKGRLIADLVRAGIAVFVAHTNADIAPYGVAQALADALGLVEARPLLPRPLELDKIVTFVPPAQLESLTDALAAAGAGALGRYDRCAFTGTGIGTFRPLEGANPYRGQVGEIETVDERRLEMIMRRRVRTAVVEALLAQHPYETPAFDVFELADVTGSMGRASGLGRIGRLAAPCSLAEFAAQVAGALPATAGGVRFAGDPGRAVSLVALQAGAGDDLLDVARRHGADVYLTSDLRHHPASEALAWPGAPALVDVAHWAAEWTWLPVVERVLTARLAAAGHPITSGVSTLRTDPWTGAVQAE